MGEEEREQRCSRKEKVRGIETAGQERKGQWGEYSLPASFLWVPTFMLYC